MAGRVVEKTLAPKASALAVAGALAVRPARELVKRTLVKKGRPIASGYAKR